MRLDLPVTSVTAVFCSLLILLLTARVISYRRGNRVSIGHEGHPILEKRMRAHGNAVEQIPLGLVLLALAEGQGAGFWPLVILAGIFTLGRVLHAAYFGFAGFPFTFRTTGMLLTLTGTIGFMVLVITTQFGG